MFGEIFRFEARYQTRQPVFWISCFFFFLLTFLAVTTDAVQIGGSIGNVNRNAPYVIMQMLLLMSLIGVFATTAFVASAVVRDIESGAQELFYSTPVKKRDYLLGRFSGALVTAMLVSVPVVLGIMTGSFMPWLEAERVGRFLWLPYVFSIFALVLPNTILTGSLFFSLATATRNMMFTYAGVVGMFVVYSVAGGLLSDMENEQIASVLDPFGLASFSIATKYWTVAEKNSQSFFLSGPFAMNRLAWLAVAGALFAWTYRRFKFTLAEGRSRRRRGRSVHVDETEQSGAIGHSPDEGRRRLRPGFAIRDRMRQYLHQTIFEVGGIVRSLAFPIILAFGVLNMVGNSMAIDQIYGTPVYPVTHLMIRILQGASLFLFIIVTFYSGEVVWREREMRLNEVFDALPVPGWVLWGAKAAALVFVIFAMMVTSIVTGILIQAFRGYFDFETGLYLKGMLLVAGVPFVLASILALALQVFANNKYLGFLLMIAYFISDPALSALDFDHNMYKYASAPSAQYSDMNGYGHFVQPLFWYYLYWCIFAAILLILVHLLWVRGSDEGFRTRLRIARRRLSRAAVTCLSSAVLAFTVTGSYIFYNTNILNEYIPGNLEKERQARFERQYKQHEKLPQPRIIRVNAEVDIYPERRAVDIRGTYRLRNKTEVPVESLHLTVNRLVKIREIDVPGAQLQSADRELGYYIYSLDRPIEPGANMEMRFDLGVENKGFLNHGSNTLIVRNGTFFNNFHYFPHIGYQRIFELEDPNERRKRGLPPIERMPPIDDEDARQGNYITRESDWIEFETTVSTSPQQIAIAPGYLQREWINDGRRYFHYKMDSPILGLFAYLSAEWVVARDHWGEVAIEVYHHRDHPYNVGRMIDAVKKSLDYCSREFSPYQHRQVRIVEFPRYASFAQSLPNTIPFSESIGFIARLDDKDDEAIDYVFYVTAHEVAHQWWAHQVMGGNVQGATMLTETMAQYSALMIMEKEYGTERMRRFLKYELDKYLRSRGGELIEELPLILVENQPYIHYQKGSVIMYALRDYLGERPLNDALARYVTAVRFEGPPYTISRDLLSFVRRQVPEHLGSLLRDLFETITLHDNQLTAATWKRTEDGNYLVRMEAESRKLRADGRGNETGIPVDDWIDVAVFGAKEPGGPPEGKILGMEKRHITSENSVIEMEVREEPRKAGIDPLNKLIDRNPENNIVPVKKLAGF